MMGCALITPPKKNPLINQCTGKPISLEDLISDLPFYVHWELYEEAAIISDEIKRLQDLKIN